MPSACIVHFKTWTVDFFATMQVSKRSITRMLPYFSFLVDAFTMPCTIIDYPWPR